MKEKTKEQLGKELKALRKRIRELEKNRIEHRQPDGLPESAEGWRFWIQNITDIIMTVARDGKILAINHSVPGITVAETIGKSIYDYVAFQHCDVMRKSLERVFQTGKPDTSEILGIGAQGPHTAWYEARILPIQRDKQVIAVTLISRDITQRKKTERRLEALNKELLKSNRRFKQLTLRDSHTGLYNHRYLEEVIEAEFYRAKRYEHPVSVIMLDVDYFKSINDVYGHQFGDLVLKQLARQLKRMVRRYDVVVRFGGEEFVIISPGTYGASAIILARRLLDALNLYNFGDKKHVIELKLSVAVASHPEDKIVEGMGLIELAEQILSKAKEHGGNRVYSSVDIGRVKRPVLEEKREAPGDIKFLREKIEKLTKQANQSLMESVFAFAKTIKLKDRYTGEHVERIVYYATEMARALNLPKDEIERIRQASILHDLGKIGISEKILLKRAKLSKKEFEEIKKHPQIGVDIIRPIQFLHNIIPLILYHQERWNGGGYPKGLKREEIPVGARIVAIADVYQALISNRPYRKAYSLDEAIEIIKKGSGSQFDPKIVNIFLKILKKEKRLKI